ncbi:MAG TPA: FtsX-like permease family protein, partial [Terriglobales bacterium]
PIPVSYDFRPDTRVLLFTFALTLITGLAFGLAPALQATRAEITPALKQGGDLSLSRFPRLSLRNTLMVSQMAGSLTLLVILGFMAFGIQTTMGIQAGLEPRNLYLISVDPVRDGYSGEQAAQFLQKMLDQVKALPFVTSATLTESVPVSLADSTVRVSKRSEQADVSRVADTAVRHVVGKDYFETTGIRLLMGRSFRKDDEANDSATVIVSEEMVRRLWKGEDPVGRRIEIGDGEPIPAKILPGTINYRSTTFGGRRTFEVVGVARDVAEGLIVQKPRPAIYFPLHPTEYSEPSPEGVTLIVRSTPGVDAIAVIEREIAAMDKNITPFNARSMSEHVGQFMAPLRAASWTYGLIGVFGLILAAVGLAGMTAYSVTQRSREIGIRMALGARKNDVLRLIMKEGAVLVALGSIIGAAGASAGERLLSAMSSTVGRVNSASTSDPIILIGAPLLLAALALSACYVPARKSVRVPPIVVLRHE